MRKLLRSKGLATTLFVALMLIGRDARGDDSLFADQPLRVESDEPLRLIVAGDTDMSSTLRSGLLAVQRRDNPHAIVLTGDNFYDCGVTSISDPQWSDATRNYAILAIPIFPVLGNHDYGDPALRAKGRLVHHCGKPNPRAQIEATGTIRSWTFPARNYVVRGRNADLFFIDTIPIAYRLDRPFLGSATADETEEWLTAQLRESRAKWRIVIGHHTVFSSGVYGGDQSTTAEMKRFSRVLKEGNVDLYVSGHEHHLELLGDPQRRDGQPLYLISGAGMKTRPAGVKNDPMLPAVFPAVDAKPFIGFALIELYDDRLEISFHDRLGKQQHSSKIKVQPRSKHAVAPR